MEKGLATLSPVPPGSHGYYCDLPRAVRVCSSNLLWDASCGEKLVFCTGQLALVVGTWVILRNVRIRPGPCVEVTPRSSVVAVVVLPPPQPPEEPAEEKKRLPRTKPVWRCPKCRNLYHQSSATCFRCRQPRPKRCTLEVMVAPRPKMRVSPTPQEPIPVSSMTEVLHSNVKVTRLRDVVSTLQPTNAKYLVEVSVVDILPADSRHWTRAFCTLCAQPTEAACRLCGGEHVEWRYMMQLRVRDGTVTIPVMICDDLFFHALPPCDLWTNHATHALLVGAMDRLRCARRVRLAVQSYIPHGRTERVFQVFGTRLVV